MGNRATENKTRSWAAAGRAWECARTTGDRACRRDWPTGPGPGPTIEYCPAHGCHTPTRHGTRCANAATYPELGVCGVHLDAGGAA